MAITLTSSWQEIDSKRDTWGGRDVEVKLYARYDPDRRGLTETRVEQKCTVIFHSGGGFTGTWCSGGGHYAEAYYQHPNESSASWKEETGTPSQFNGTGATTYTDIAYDYWTVKCTNGEASLKLGTYWIYGYYGMTEANTEFYTDVSLPSLATPPSGLAMSNLTPGVDSFTATVSITDWGQGASSTPNDRYRELQVWTYSSSGLNEPRRWQAVRGTALSSSITVDNNSFTSATPLIISANTRYVIGIYASNGNANTGSIRQQSAYTLPPDLTSATSGTQTYNTFDKINVPVTVNVPSDGGALTKTIQYRIKKDSEAWGDWLDFDTYSGGSAGTSTGTIILDSDSNYTVEFRSSTTAGVSPNTISLSVTTLATHESPIFSNFVYRDIEASTVTVTGNDQYLIQGLSNLYMEVPVADKAEPSDPNFPMVSYDFIFDGDTQNESYSSSQAVYAEFTPSTSGSIPASVKAIDSLGGNTVVNKVVPVLPYAPPTIEASFRRVNDEGQIQISVAGDYAPLEISSVEKNSIRVYYQVIDSEGTLIDWTEIPLTASDGDYEGASPDIPTTYDGTYLVNAKVVDAFFEKEVQLEVSSFSREKKLHIPQWDVEVWTRDGLFLADITRYIQGDLSITWALNDIEDVSFDVSLDAMALLAEGGLSDLDIITPYAHDIKVRRDGYYVVGCNVVSADIEIPNEGPPKMKVKATGYLNLFKDQYISEPMAGYTYPEMAHKLLNRAQHADCLIKNPTGDIDASYWLSPVASVAQTTVSYAGAGAIQCTASSTGWRGLGTPMNVKAGTPINIDVWVSGQATNLYIRERELINISSTQGTMVSTTLTGTGVYTHITGTYTTIFDNGYIYIEQNQTTNTPIRVDNCFVSRADDEDSLNNQYVDTIYVGLDDTTGGQGNNYATTGYISSREYAYELQNVKDALMDLTKMEDDYFEFEFTPFKVFNTYDRKGQDKPELELLYPGNIESFSVNRSAQDLANKVQVIGSGIGDERIESYATDRTSRQTYGTHESVITENNVSLEETLNQMAVGKLNERHLPTQELSVVIKDGSISCANVETGDTLPFTLGTYLGVLGQQEDTSPVRLDLLKGLEGWYKIKKLQSRISVDGAETVNLTLEYEGSFYES